MNPEALGSVTHMSGDRSESMRQAVRVRAQIDYCASWINARSMSANGSWKVNGCVSAGRSKKSVE